MMLSGASGAEFCCRRATECEKARWKAVGDRRPAAVDRRGDDDDDGAMVESRAADAAAAGVDRASGARTAADSEGLSSERESIL